MAKRTILIVEDAFSLAQVYAGYLNSAGFETLHAESAAGAHQLLSKQPVSAVMLDIGLPDGDGIDVLRQIRLLYPGLPVVMVTANASIAMAVQAVREGAHDYLVKPITRDRLISTLEPLMAGSGSARINAPAAHPDAADFHGLVGRSAPMRNLFQRIERVAQSRAPAFITGESGTGKELCAEAIHRLSERSAGPFVPINCGAIPKELMESEIFGHLKGSFTGAIADRDGAARLANGGTLFLDEVCEMDVTLQTKMLRFLQTGLVHRVGAPAAEKVDVRIVCATNRDPVDAVKSGHFRNDLFYRLHVLPVHMPALRDRGGDIILLARHFLALTALEEAKQAMQISDGASATLLGYRWPGNVRELQNAVRQAVVLHDVTMLEPYMLPEYISSDRASGGLAETTLQMPAPGDADLRRVERITIERAIASCGGSVPRAAKLLGVSPSTIYRKREAWGANPPN